MPRTKATFSAPLPEAAGTRIALLAMGLDRPPLDWMPEITAKEWEAVREEVWEVWARQVDAGARGAYPPRGAILHDGITGDVFRKLYSAPEGYEGGWDATETILGLVDTAKRELHESTAHVPDGYRQRVEIVRQAMERGDWQAYFAAVRGPLR